MRWWLYCERQGRPAQRIAARFVPACCCLGASSHVMKHGSVWGGTVVPTRQLPCAGVSGLACTAEGRVAPESGQRCLTCTTQMVYTTSDVLLCLRRFEDVCNHPSACSIRHLNAMDLDVFPIVKLWMRANTTMCLCSRCHHHLILCNKWW